MVELLAQGDLSIQALSTSFPMSFQAVSKHVMVLQQADIVVKKREGKFRILSLNNEAFRPAIDWISYHGRMWNASFDRLDELTNQKDGD